MASIRVADIGDFHWHVVFGLEILGSGRLYVGCSFRVDGDVIDQPARWVNSPAKVLWKVAENERPRVFNERKGEVIFALYSDETQKERLADTGWVRWQILGAGVIDMAKTDAFMNRAYRDKWDES